MSEKMRTFAAIKEFTMEDNFAIQLFEGKKVRIVWDEELNSKWGTICTPVEMRAFDGKRSL